VLITTIMAVVVGLILFLADDQWERIRLSLGAPSIGMPIAIRIVAGALLVVLATVIGKGLGKHGRVLQGGLVSGHSALGFYFATCTFFVSDNLLASAIAVLLASLVAQSRYEAKFHSFFELSLGALVGVLFGVMLFGLLPK
jgi:diacylglycerol kinase (ATP)